MRSRKFSYIRHKLKVGLKRRCPDCELGKIFTSHFHLNEKCPYCGCRFERGAGSAIGGMYINIALAELTALAGFFFIGAVTDIPGWHQLFIWIPYVLVFSGWFYPYARGLWIAVLYLAGEIHPDFDYEREYFASDHIPLNRTPQEHEE